MVQRHVRAVGVAVLDQLACIAALHPDGRAARGLPGARGDRSGARTNQSQLMRLSRPAHSRSRRTNF